MSEHHQILGDTRGEPQPAGSVGVRVRIRLSGFPSNRWCDALRVNLSNELVGHAAIGHIRLNDVVQGDQIVLEGVEANEAPTLAASLQRAVEATNKAGIHEKDFAPNMAQKEADAVADEVAFTDRRSDERAVSE